MLWCESMSTKKELYESLRTKGKLKVSVSTSRQVYELSKIKKKEGGV